MNIKTDNIYFGSSTEKLNLSGMKIYNTNPTHRTVDTIAPLMPSIRALKKTAGKNQIHIEGSTNGQNNHSRAEAATGKRTAISKLPGFLSLIFFKVTSLVCTEKYQLKVLNIFLWSRFPEMGH
jgi:hypothetical protein